MVKVNKMIRLNALKHQNKIMKIDLIKKAVLGKNT